MCPASIETSWPETMSHTRTLWSNEPLTARRPLTDSATERMSPLWPDMVDMHCPVWRFQARTVSSCDPETTTCAWTAMPRTVFACPSSTRRHVHSCSAPGPLAHTRKVVSCEPEIIELGFATATQRTVCVCPINEAVWAA